MHRKKAIIPPKAGAGENGQQRARKSRKREGTEENASALLSGIMENTPDLIAAVNTRCEYIACNEAYRKECREIFGVDFRLGASVAELLAGFPEDEKSAVRLFGRALQGETVVVTEEFGRPGETRRCYELRFSPIVNREGRITGAAQVGRNITKRNRTEEELRQSEERFRLMFSESSVGKAESDPATGRFLRVNPALCRITGYSEEELLERTFSEITHPEDRESDLERFRRLLRGEVRSYRCEKRYLRPDGSLVWADVTVNLLHDASGQAVRSFAVVQDTTERKRAEEALRESEEKFRRVLESSSDSILVWDREYNYVYANGAAMEHVGVTSDKVIGKNMRDGLGHVPEFMRLWMGRVDQGFATGQSFRVEDRVRMGERVVHSESQISPIRNAAGEVFAVGVVYRDVTERKRAEEALRAAEARFRALVTASSDVVFRMSPDWEELQQMQGRRASGNVEAPERGWVEKYIHPEDQAQVRAVIQEAIRTRSVLELEHRVVEADGRVGWRFSRAVPLLDERGEITEWFGAASDVTKRKRAEEALRESESRAKVAAAVEGERRRLLEVLETLPVMICLLTPDFRVAFANRSFREKFAETKDGHCYEQCFGEKERCTFCETYRVLETGQSQHWEVRWPDGRVIEAHDFPFRDVDGSPMILKMGIDITERRKAEGALKEANERLAERTAKLQELVGELEHLSYTITHDMKAPLRAMRGFAEVAAQASDLGEARPFLGKIGTAAERMDALIRDALNYSQAVRQELPLEDVDTGALLRGILDSYPQFQPWKATIRVEGTLPVVMGNEAGLTQCFSNLLGNAVKFVKRGEVPEVRVRAEERGGWSRIWVEDHGIGIPPALQPRLFHMFVRASKEYEGTGIGLALVRKVVQKMGGRLGVESEEGKGSRFWMELKNGVRQPSREEAAASGEAEGKGGTVLYVEDEQDDAMFMTRAFAVKGREPALRVVSDGRAAIEYLSGAGKYGDRKEYPLPAVVLLDLNLPLVPGFEVLEWMRNHPDFARTPVVVFSSSTREDDQVKARKLGANVFVTKPSSGLEFGRVVDELRKHGLGGG